MCDKAGRSSSKQETWWSSGPQELSNPSNVLGGYREGLGSIKPWEGFSGLVINQITAVTAIIYPRPGTPTPPTEVLCLA